METKKIRQIAQNRLGFKPAAERAAAFTQAPSNVANGFTMIELLVVISIIALLGSVAMTGLATARAKSRDAKRVADMNQMAKAFELYFNDFRSYPTNGYMGFGAGGGALGTVAIPPNLSKYINLYPVVPKPADGSCVDGTDAKGKNNYWYEASASGSTYTVTFCLGPNVHAPIHSGTMRLTPGGFR